jgi:hypothetical protein
MVGSTGNGRSRWYDERARIRGIEGSDAQRNAGGNERGNRVAMHAEPAALVQDIGIVEAKQAISGGEAVGTRVPRIEPVDAGPPLEQIGAEGGGN